MKVDYKIVQQRRDDIMMIIQKLGNVTVKQLMNDFNVSEITIRRDLQYWEDRGAIIRYHGGAKIVQHMVNHDNSDFTNERYKHAIAKKAASYIEDGDTVFINTSSTALLIPQYIMNKRCTIITNNAKMVLVKHSPLISIVLTGGELRYPKEAMVGDFALNNLHKIRANKCFLGCSGMSSTSVLQLQSSPKLQSMKLWLEILLEVSLSYVTIQRLARHITIYPQMLIS